MSVPGAFVGAGLDGVPGVGGLKGGRVLLGRPPPRLRRPVPSPMVGLCVASVGTIVGGMVGMLVGGSVGVSDGLGDGGLVVGDSVGVMVGGSEGVSVGIREGDGDSSESHSSGE